jgi:hypothetical protein
MGTGSLGLTHPATDDNDWTGQSDFHRHEHSAPISISGPDQGSPER